MERRAFGVWRRDYPQRLGVLNRRPVQYCACQQKRNAAVKNNKAPLAPESGSLGDRETRAHMEETAATV